MVQLKPEIQSIFQESTLEFYLNGTKIILRDPNPLWTLLDFIRSQDDLKGTKLGCGEGGCGACTVVLQTFDKSSDFRLIKHLAVNACLFPLVGVVGKHVITIEGLGNAENPHPLQERIATLHGSQCGFCTPGIVMSLYALIRNSYDPISKVFQLSANDVELEGHLDGNLCRCTGYKPILQAARTFITDDLKGKISILRSDTIDENGPETNLPSIPLHSDIGPIDVSNKNGSCGRIGGCCRDSPDNGSSRPRSSSPEESSNESPARLSETSISSPNDDTMFSNSSMSHDLKNIQHSFIPHHPQSELIFPTALRKFTKTPLYYGNDTNIWLVPTTLEQLLLIKEVYPTAKLVCGASETQVEVRFKYTSFPVSVYVSEIEELQDINVPEDDKEFQSCTEIIFGANTPLTGVEDACRKLSQRLGQRGSVFEAIRKQLRYFAGRQIRNVASLAGNIVTASPISDINPVLMASDSILTIQSRAQGKIELPMSDFFVSYRTTKLPIDAVIVDIRVPLPSPNVREITKAYKQAKRKDDDIAIVTAAFRVRLDDDAVVSQVSLVYGGMAPMTIKASKTMKFLLGKPWNDSTTLNKSMERLAEEFNLKYDVPGGMASYRQTLAISLFFRFWHEVISDLGMGNVDPDLINEIHRGISSGTRDNHNPYEQRVVGKQIPHLSALKQTTGEAEYIDDMPRQHRELFGAMVLSSHAHAKLVEVDWTSAVESGLALGYVDVNSIPRDANLWGSIVKDEPFFADGEVFSHGQPIGLVYAETALQAQAAARAVQVEYEDLPIILTIDEAIQANSYFPYGNMLKKGVAIEDKMDDIWASCDKIFEGTTRIGGQEHFYLETNAAMVIPNKEDGTYEVCMETQEFVAQVTGVPSSRVNARVKRMGGAFGGKESRSVQLACLLAVAAKKTKRPVRCMLNRDEDMMTTGQRHPIQARWKVGVKSDGRLIALEADVYDNAGFSQDMSAAVMGRCLTHFDNCYEIPNVLLRGHVCKTNTHSNTAFRGFGGPQAMFFTETYMTAISEGLSIPIDELRLRNLYKQGDHTPFLQTIDQDWHVPLLLDQIKHETNYPQRLLEIETYNQEHKYRKRGISLLPTKFGLSFATALHLNQASASLKIYADGSILLNHGGTEMGQGLYTKMAQICAQELNVPISSIFTQDTSSYQTANASPTAASSGSDLNGMAVMDACQQLNARLAPYREKVGQDASMKELAHAAYRDRVHLSASGFWKMPRIGYEWGVYDREIVKDMYYYFTQGVAATEVELDILTGHHTVLRTDILMDIGRSINPAIDYGQIEGAYVQGMGLFTMEESLWTREGQLFTKGPGTYKIPGFADIPQVFNVAFLKDGEGKEKMWQGLKSVQSSKGVGEPPLFLGAGVFFALRMAVRSARVDNGLAVGVGGEENGKGGSTGWNLDSPATVERLRMAVGDEISGMGRVKRKEGEVGFFVSVA
ncbi:xanthine dehydrogenase [Sclerotinia borealis F-4128]|uniref:Xanthine dehydrogenase n=1 Tax=Sclerotinia borealis (strain F-4128) TaxID=1432307 RepID=W9CFL4_SCLBF|nr:xanthine dehydrogenase [Sclerotinia borealis F-4128]